MYKVLIVEDDPMVSMINEQYVNRNKNFRCVGTISNGEAALEYLRENPVDLLILDVFMPAMNGLETLHAIRNERIPVNVIMVTAANDMPTLEETMHLGVVAYLLKPFSYDHFQDALNKYLAQMEAMKDIETLNQKQIDYIIDTKSRSGNDILPKGIQEKTLDAIVDYMRTQTGRWMTSDEIADHVEFSRVTVRRYMNHLVQTGMVNGAINYETGGRPCMLYKLDGLSE